MDRVSIAGGRHIADMIIKWWSGRRSNGSPFVAPRVIRMRAVIINR